MNLMSLEDFRHHQRKRAKKNRSNGQSLRPEGTKLTATLDALRLHPGFVGRIKYNQLLLRVEIDGRAIGDQDVTLIREQIERESGRQL